MICSQWNMSCVKSLLWVVLLWSNCNKLTSFTKNPSITEFFKPSILNIKRKEACTQVTCKYLHGPKYDKYILRTETRSLGGISPQLHAWLVCQILHYKKHPSLKSSTLIGTSTVLWLKLETLGVPDHGNEAVAGWNWTEVEQKRVDDVLKKWACWEVNFVHRFVHSTACEGMTENHNKICDAWRELARDESLKCSIHHVSPRSQCSAAEDYWLSVECRRTKRQNNWTMSSTRFTKHIRNTHCILWGMWRHVI